MTKNRKYPIADIDRECDYCSREFGLATPALFLCEDPGRGTIQAMCLGCMLDTVRYGSADEIASITVIDAEPDVVDAVEQRHLDLLTRED